MLIQLGFTTTNTTSSVLTHDFILHFLPCCVIKCSFSHLTAQFENFTDFFLKECTFVSYILHSVPLLNTASKEQNRTKHHIESYISLHIVSLSSHLKLFVLEARFRPTLWSKRYWDSIISF